MKKYLLLIRGSFAKWNQLSESRRQEVRAEFGKFAASLASQGFMRDGDGCGERSFRIFRSGMSTSESLVPLETQDMVTGYFMIEVPSESAALEIAAQCPAFSVGEHVELVPCGE
ncbi:MAG TPA: YciI family protein [Pseudobdellovibrionaceae bacterium]|nr:YciI family protein [Pseudobdellovibrionaceae bacterium]